MKNLVVTFTALAVLAASFIGVTSSEARAACLDAAPPLPISLEEFSPLTTPLQGPVVSKVLSGVWNFDSDGGPLIKLSRIQGATPKAIEDRASKLQSYLTDPAFMSFCKKIASADSTSPKACYDSLSKPAIRVKFKEERILIISSDQKSAKLYTLIHVTYGSGVNKISFSYKDPELQIQIPRVDDPQSKIITLTRDSGETNQQNWGVKIESETQLKLSLERQP